MHVLLLLLAHVICLVINNSCLAYHTSLVANDPSLTTLSAAENGNYVVPSTNRWFGDRAFSVAAPKAWNSLPTDLKTASCSTDAFKPRLKTWLFKRAYNWHSDYYYYNYFLQLFYQCFLLLYHYCIIIIIVMIILIIILSSPFDIMRHRSLHVL